MSDDALSLGTITRQGDGYQGRLTRTFEHPPAKVWSMLTESPLMAQWLSAGSIEQRPGGKVRIDFVDSGIVIDSSVSAFEAGRLLEYSWSSASEPERPLRWELKPAGAGTELVLSVGVPAGEDAAKACAGFEGHLEMLAAALEGVPIKFPFQTYLQARTGYQAMLGA
ncbi:SRPBCC family protein [Comamonas sp. NLF-1-9]|uniref:SRPBCC family protein n=1 Tax=Comamonas sp. NLF-1-9 TaxID=2853163 RepID=UPI001C493874|nr:SRPBCC family protein [Comamonas sp. NLF-1-9]QXL85003.1 SRPBCC family protein [Comamonas sp. NLF-1-9]